MTDLLTDKEEGDIFKLIVQRYQRHVNLIDRPFDEETRTFMNGL